MPFGADSETIMSDCSRVIENAIKFCPSLSTGSKQEAKGTLHLGTLHLLCCRFATVHQLIRSCRLNLLLRKCWFPKQFKCRKLSMKRKWSQYRWIYYLLYQERAALENCSEYFLTGAKSHHRDNYHRSPLQGSPSSCETGNNDNSFLFNRRWQPKSCRKWSRKLWLFSDPRRSSKISRF